MRNTYASLVVGLSLVSVLTLSGCSSAESLEPTVSGSPSAPTPIPDSSVSENLVPSQDAPFGFDLPEEYKSTFAGLTGTWVYRVSEAEAVALSDIYDAENLREFVELRVADGWFVAVPEQQDENGLVVVLENEIGNQLTVVGLVSGAPDSSGGTSAPASVVTFTKN